MSCVIFMLKAIRNQALLFFQVDHDSYVSEIPEYLNSWFPRFPIQSVKM